MARRSRKVTFRTRYGDEWWETRKLALQKTDYRCDCCGKAHGRRVRLQVHHIVPWTFLPDNSLDNLAPLCFHCHKAIHKLYRACAVNALAFKAVYNHFKQTARARVCQKRGARGYRRATIGYA